MRGQDNGILYSLRTFLSLTSGQNLSGMRRCHVCYYWNVYKYLLKIKKKWIKKMVHVLNSLKKI